MPASPRPPRHALLTVVVATALVVLAAALLVRDRSAGPGARSDAPPVVITAATDSCSWPGRDPRPGSQTFTVSNRTRVPARIVLVDAATGGIWAQTGNVAGGSSRTVDAVLPAGSYLWRCIPIEGTASVSPTRATAGTGDGAVPGQPLFAISAEEVTDAVALYRAAVSDGLGQLAGHTDQLAAAVAAGDVPGARGAWLAAHLDYERLGAAYGTFGDLADALDGLPQGLPGGADDEGFTGFLRVEDDLWHDGSPARVAADATQLDQAVHQLVDSFAEAPTDPADIPLRAHEILEMTAQRELTGRSDQGSHTGLATARANVDGTAMVLETLTVPLQRRDPQLLADAQRGLADLTTGLDALRQPDGGWPALEELTTRQRQDLDARLGALLELLAQVPDVLPMPPSTTPS